ncbi:unnamed protein product, partial [Closterium sp. NIES-54]
RSPLDKGHQSEPATPKPMLKETVGPFAANDIGVSLEKKLASLSFMTLEDNTYGETNTAVEGKGKEAEANVPAAEVRADPVDEEDEEEM